MVEKSDSIWMDGKFIKWDDAKVHVLSHALHYGSAVFEGIKCYETGKGPAIFRLKEHNDRLFHSAEVFHMKVPFSKKEIFDAIKQTVKINKLKSCYIRPIIYLGYGPMGLNPVKSPVNVSIAVWPWGAYLGEEGIKNGISIRTSSYPRNHANSDLASAKISGQYVNSILAKREAVTQGYDEAVMLDPKGNVSECSGENIFIVKDKKIKTTPLGTILPGITRASIIQLAKDFGYEVREEYFKTKEIFDADECFLTGTAAELTPVRALDKKPIGAGKPGPVTMKLQKAFMDILHGKNGKYEKWLEYV